MARFAWMVVVAMGCSGGGELECDTASNCLTVDSSDTAEPGPARIERVDVGEACVDGALTATVVIENCVSTCVRDVQSSCTLEVVGDQLVVSAEASWLPPPTGSCDAACLVVQATCTATAPDDGDYTVVYGGAEASATLPLTEAVCVSAD